MNEQDPLAQLRDIRVPEPVGWWPPAPGWWILALLLLAILAAGLWWYRRQRARKAYRRAACRELEAAWLELQQGGPREAYIRSLTQILRRTALAAYPASVMISLHGQAWLQFLDATMGTAGFTGFSRGPGRDLSTLPYRAALNEPALESQRRENQDLQPLHSLVMQWLEQHSRLQETKVREMTQGMRHAAV